MQERVLSFALRVRVALVLEITCLLLPGIGFVRHFSGLHLSSCGVSFGIHRSEDMPCQYALRIESGCLVPRVSCGSWAHARPSPKPLTC